MQKQLTSAVSSMSRGVRRIGSDTRLATPANDGFTNLRTLGSLGPWMRDQPSHVVELQKFFGHTNAPTYAKGEADKFFNSGVLFISLTGLTMAAYGELRTALRSFSPPPTLS